jgi:hypothetical protein
MYIKKNCAQQLLYTVHTYSAFLITARACKGSKIKKIIYKKKANKSGCNPNLVLPSKPKSRLPLVRNSMVWPRELSEIFPPHMPILFNYSTNGHC